MTEQLPVTEHPMYQLKQELNGENTVCDHAISKCIIMPKHKGAKLSYGYIISLACKISIKGISLLLLSVDAPGSKQSCS